MDSYSEKSFSILQNWNLNWFFNKKGIRDSILQSNANWPFVRMRVRERAQATMHEWFGMNGCWNMCEESILFTTNPWMAKQSNPNRQSMKDFVRPSRHFAPITQLQCTLPLNMKLGMDLYCIDIVECMYRHYSRSFVSFMWFWLFIICLFIFSKSKNVIVQKVRQNLIFLFLLAKKKNLLWFFFSNRQE